MFLEWCYDSSADARDSSQFFFLPEVQHCFHYANSPRSKRKEERERERERKRFVPFLVWDRRRERERERKEGRRGWLFKNEGCREWTLKMPPFHSREKIFFSLSPFPSSLSLSSFPSPFKSSTWLFHGRLEQFPTSPTKEVSLLAFFSLPLPSSRHIFSSLWGHFPAREYASRRCTRPTKKKEKKAAFCFPKPFLLFRSSSDPLCSLSLFSLSLSLSLSFYGIKLRTW